MRCPECKLLVPQKTKQCPGCGFQFPKAPVSKRWGGIIGIVLGLLVSPLLVQKINEFSYKSNFLKAEYQHALSVLEKNSDPGVMLLAESTKKDMAAEYERAQAHLDSEAIEFAGMLIVGCLAVIFIAYWIENYIKHARELKTESTE